MVEGGSTPPGGEDAAESIYADWITLEEEGRAEGFEEFVRAHPGHEAQLRRLHADRAAFESILRRGIPGSLSGDGAVALPPLRLEDGPDAAEPAEQLFERLRIRVPTAGRYRYRGRLGAGGGGVVLKVWDEKLGRTLAMKLVTASELDLDDGTPRVDGRRLARFVDEARIGSQLDHPGIVTVHEVGIDEHGQAFFTMKLVEGEDLSAVFAHVRAGHADWSVTRALGVLIAVCEALAHAHERGVVHRDLKPANVRVGRHGQVHVMDWGLARVLGEAERCDLKPRMKRSAVRSLRHPAPDAGATPADVSVNGDVIGTPAYMPPEQALGQIDRIGPSADVYAIGAMLYELLGPSGG